MDEGRLTDNKGRIADFKNTIIIMTSNIGSHLIQEAYDSEKNLEKAAEKSQFEVLELLRKSVRPEFLNRIDDIVMFTPLDKDAIAEIVRLQIEQLKKMLAKQEITIDATDQAIDYLAEAGFDPHYGARPIKRIIQKKVINALSKEILGQTINKNSVVLIDAFEDQLVFRNQEVTI